MVVQAAVVVAASTVAEQVAMQILAPRQAVAVAWVAVLSGSDSLGCPMWSRPFPYSTLFTAKKAE